MPSHKRARGASSSKQSSSSTSYDENKYISKAASERALDLATKTIVQERGLKTTYEALVGNIKQRDWEKFVLQPKQSMVAIVREFYANAPEPVNGKVFVRGKYVKVDRESINAFYGLPNIENDQYTEFDETTNFEDIVLTIAESGTQWEKNAKGQHIRFPQKALTKLCKAWHYFIMAKLIPGTHYSTIDATRCILIYALATGLSIDVGKLIESQIVHSLNNKNLGLFFPTMISEMCLACGVKPSKVEEKMSSKGVITDKMIFGYKQSKIASSSHGPEAAQPPPPLSPITFRTLNGRLDNCEARLENMERYMQEGFRRIDQRFDEVMSALTHYMAHLHVTNQEEQHRNQDDPQV